MIQKPSGQASRGCSHSPCTWKGKESCQVLMKRDHQRGVPGVPQLQEVSSESWSKINNCLVVSIPRYSKVFGSEMLGFSPLHPLIDHNFPPKQKLNSCGYPIDLDGSLGCSVGMITNFQSRHLKVSAQSHESSTIQQEKVYCKQFRMKLGMTTVSSWFLSYAKYAV